MPFATSAACSAPVVNGAGFSTTYTYRRGIDREPMRPETVMVPSVDLLTEILAPDPATVRTLLISGIAVVAGSRVAPSPGLTFTQTRFSFSDNPDTRAAYPACRYRVSHPSGIFWSSNALASPITL